MDKLKGWNEPQIDPGLKTLFPKFLANAPTVTPASDGVDNTMFTPLFTDGHAFLVLLISLLVSGIALIALIPCLGI
ncbi:MAG: hypothetical protein P8X83_05345 [Nitrosopumilaceae archaeon]